jgi:hypothetical protein
MSESREPEALHPVGEADPDELGYPEPHRVRTPGGTVEVRWEDDPGVSPYGLLTYFFEFLDASGIWREFVEECPLHYTSPNAPTRG